MVSKRANQYLHDIFIELAEAYEDLGDQYRANAYAAAAAVVVRIDSDRITRGIKPGDFRGLGKTMCDHITEYNETGKVGKVRELKSSKEYKAYHKFIHIPGFGRAAVHALLRRGIFTIRDIPRDSLNALQIAGLKYHKDLEQRIPRETVRQLGAFINKLLFSGGASLMKICGSYARGAADSGDVDILIRATHPANVLRDLAARLKDHEKVVFIAAAGPQKIVAYIVDAAGIVRHVDIMATTSEDFPAFELYLIGSKQFNIRMRAQARARGFMLNQYGLFDKDGKKVKVQTQQDIFAAIGMTYIVPSARGA